MKIKFPKWSKKAYRVRKELYHFMKDNQELFKHPDASLLSKKHWKTTAWNAAWMAAESIDKKL